MQGAKVYWSWCVEGLRAPEQVARVVVMTLGDSAYGPGPVVMAFFTILRCYAVHLQSFCSNPIEVKQDVTSARRAARWIETQLFFELISKLRVRICGLEYLISSKFHVRM